MIIEQFYLGCLAHASYLIGCGGEAAVIDPQRDVDLYLDAAARHKLRIAHVIETHLHADFVSGHRELAERTGARIYLGARSGAKFDHVAVADGDTIRVGSCELRFIDTPGHTIESICVALIDPATSSSPCALFTGDTLFVGDVGRPDLAPDHTPQELAGLLYDSLHNKLLNLPDDVVVYPAHGAGSLCGRQMGAEHSSTIGRERDTNYALRIDGRDEFVKLMTADLPPRPEYFAADVELNRSGAPLLTQLPALRELGPGQAAELVRDGAVLLDTRSAMDFAAAHIPGSVHIGLSGQYASWAARIIGLNSTVVLLTEDSERVREAHVRLARVGIEHVAGYLAGGITAWVQAGLATEPLAQISVQQLADWLADPPEPAMLLDVREPAELGTGVVPQSIPIPLGELTGRLVDLPRSQWTFVHCQSGYRSSIAGSLLRRAGFERVVNVTGGFNAWKSAGLPVATPETNPKVRAV